MIITLTPRHPGSPINVMVARIVRFHAVAGEGYTEVVLDTGEHLLVREYPSLICDLIAQAEKGIS